MLTLEAKAISEVGQFFASQPSLEQIIAFHASPELTERVYTLIAAEKTGTATDEERRELDKIDAIQHIIIRTKGEALKKLKQKTA